MVRQKRRKAQKIILKYFVTKLRDQILRKSLGAAHALKDILLLHNVST